MSHATVAAAGLAALAIAMGVGRFAFTPLLPMMQADAGITIAQGGWLASANYLGYLAGALTAGALRMEPARLIRAGLALVGASTLAMGALDAMAAWLVLRFIAGLASAWVLVFVSSWCLEQFEHDERRALLGATLFAGVGVGIAAAGAFCVWLMHAGASSAVAWIALGATSLVVAALLWKSFDAPAAGPGRAAANGGWSPAAVRMTIAYGAFGFGYIIPATFLSAMARAAFPDPAVYGWSWPAFGAAAALSTFAAALLARHLADRVAWIVGHLLMAAGVVLPLVVEGLAGILGSALLVGGTFMAVTMVAMQEARRVAGASARKLIAAMTAAFAVGQIAGPLLVSALASRGTGFDAALAIAGASLVASALLLIPRPTP